jgi:rhamnosyltransferase
MSTYNGEKYLSQQIDSIIRQKDADVELTVRDDGSSDNTTDILNKYQNENKLKWYKGDNLKPARSFMQLLKDSGNAQFYAFSDQDDYWMPDKLQAALSKIKDYDNVPALYFCQTQPADKDLHSLQRVSINPLLTFGESLVYEFVGGCTIVINRKLRDIVNSYTPEYIPMHDVWIYTIAQAVGAKIEFDSEPHILYRQHETNVIGQGNSAMHEMKRRMQRLMNKEHSRYRRALEIKKDSTA